MNKKEHETSKITYKSLKDIIRFKILNYIFIRSGLPRCHSFVLRQKQHIYPSHSINKQKLNHYLTYRNLIRGWFPKGAAQLFLLIDYIQKKEKIEGNLFEIGVYEGKSAIMLGLMTDRDKETLGLCNISDISYNANFTSYFENTDFIRIYIKPSRELIQEECDNCRFFHIDGGALAEEIYSDLWLAAKSIIQKGIIAIDIDDAPETIEGIYKFLIMEKLLAPLIIGFGKFILCKPQEQKWYLEKLENLLSCGSNKYITDSNIRLTNHNFVGHKMYRLFKSSSFL